MTSHGHGIARATHPRTPAQRDADLQKIAHYRSLESSVRDLVSRGGHGHDTFALTSKLLRLNPEYYTVWNVRRRCLISGDPSASWSLSSSSGASSSLSATGTSPRPSGRSSLSSSGETPPRPRSRSHGRSGLSGIASDGDGAPESKQPEANEEDEAAAKQRWANDLDVIKSELVFTVPLLMEHPKCYWIWNYRLWTLNQAIERLPIPVARKVWEEELGLITKMLHKDRRNFHAWGYRRFVVDQLESPELAGKSMIESEFEYTTMKIKEDLSNFSAWHYRSQHIPRLLRERNADDAGRKKLLEDELSQILNGLNVGPEDQSLWFYHQYLLDNIIEEPNDRTIAPGLTVNERRTYVENQIGELKDLLEDYKDIKWIYEALIQYTLALPKLGGKADSAELSTWLGNSRELDPQRMGRWKDLETELSKA